MPSLRPAQQLVGAVLNGRWRLVRLLGEGGMGAVYEADGVRGEGKRAIKLLHEEFVNEPQILQRFHAESQTTRNLDHPNIARVLDAATAENGTPYLVMELLQGTPLATYTDKRQVIPPEHAVPIVIGILQALSVAHAQQVVHRDLKPDNLFLVPDPRGGFTVKVLDFGIAKVMDAAGGMGNKTRTGVLLGTPGYMSPEQIKNAKGVDARSDLWSVGIILYEMMTGSDAFPSDNEFSRLTSVLTDQLRPIERAAPHLAAWGPFFARALAKDLRQRFQTADEMGYALANVARGMPMQPAAAVLAGPSVYPSVSPSTVPTINDVAPPEPPRPSGVASPRPRGNVGGGNTRASALSPGAVGQGDHVPSVHVVSAPSSKGAPWWVVAVVALGCLGGGFAAGYLVGSPEEPSRPTGTKPIPPATRTSTP